MRIAFDVQGTLINGFDSAQIRFIMVEAYRRGHNITVWSNAFEYTQDFLRDYPSHAKFVHNTEQKRSKSDMEEYGIPVFDLAFEDDRRQTYLGANNIIFVNQIPEGIGAGAYLDSIGVMQILPPGYDHGNGD